MSKDQAIVLKQPLFSRFRICQESGDPALAGAYLDKDSLYSSLLENVLFILESRNSCHLNDNPKDVTYTVVNFGIPDFTVSGGDEFHKQIKFHIERALSVLECRLVDISVTTKESSYGIMELRIHANIAQEIYKDFVFFIKIRHSGLVDVENT
ncbi:MAG: hypothetical protein A3J38_09420 [Gammaproteobacteria bacterium RIFCSPHIGHO2_12_FULL_45_9]|nr:MAG: hypothetical protein A3J38_09420 [Gammaproteobacteria bacterium RIFCSPHIGHO2_12_FULL_45_9]